MHIVGRQHAGIRRDEVGSVDDLAQPLEGRRLNQLDTEPGRDLQ